MFGTDLRPFWNDVRELLTLLAILWALIVVSWALFKLPRIIEALRYFNELRTPIWDLRNAVQTLQNVNLKTELADIVTIVEAVSKQQRRTADERREPVVAVQTQETSQTEDRWEDIRTIWTQAREKLEQIIDNISDGRIRRKYDGFTRYTYIEINDTLRADGFINRDASEAVQKMNEIFLFYRRRSQPVTADVLQQFKRWKDQFDRNIAQVLPKA